MNSTFFFGGKNCHGLQFQLGFVIVLSAAWRLTEDKWLSVIFSLLMIHEGVAGGLST